MVEGCNLGKRDFGGNGWGLGRGINKKFHFSRLPKVWIVLHNMRNACKNHINDVLAGWNFENKPILNPTISWSILLRVGKRQGAMYVHQRNLPLLLSSKSLNSPPQYEAWSPGSHQWCPQLVKMLKTNPSPTPLTLGEYFPPNIGHSCLWKIPFLHLLVSYFWLLRLRTALT